MNYTYPDIVVALSLRSGPGFPQNLRELSCRSANQLPPLLLGRVDPCVQQPRWHAGGPLQRLLVRRYQGGAATAETPLSSKSPPALAMLRVPYPSAARSATSAPLQRPEPALDDPNRCPRRLFELAGQQALGDAQHRLDSRNCARPFQLRYRLMSGDELDLHRGFTTHAGQSDLVCCRHQGALALLRQSSSGRQSPGWPISCAEFHYRFVSSY